MLTAEQKEWANRWACQLLASRTSMMPGCQDHPDRMQREQAKALDRVRHYGRLAADTWRKKHGHGDLLGGDSLDAAFAMYIAAMVAEAGHTMYRIDSENELILSNEQ
jgi:hypothetical protein